MSNSFRASLLACTALAAFSIPAFASAQDAAADDTTQLETIVVKGKRVAVKGSVADTPLATQTTAEDIRRNEISDLDDLGNTTEPGVSWVAQSQSINIRGLEGDRILTTIDGIPIPYMDDNVRGAAGGVNSFDLSSLSTIDILRGSDSSRAGSGALGGAVLLRTLEPEDLIEPGKDFGGIAKLGFDGSDASLGGSVAFAKKRDNTSVLFQGGYKYGHETDTGGDVGGYGSTRTKADPEDYHDNNVLFKIRQDIEGGHQIGVTAEHFGSKSTTDYRSQQGTTYAIGDYDRTDDTSRDRVSLDYRFDSIAEDSIVDSAFATLYWQKTTHNEGTSGERLTSPIGDYSRLAKNKNNAFGFTGFVNSDFVTDMLRHQVTLGGDVQFSQTSQFSSGEDTCPAVVIPFTSCAFLHTNAADMPDTDAWKVGLFVEDRITFGDSNFSLTPGLRFDWYDYNPQSTAGYSDTLPSGNSDYQFSPKLRAAWQVRPDVELFAQFSTAFKAPNVSQLYSSYDNAPVYRLVGNPDLEAETGYNFEVGANLGDEEFGGRISAFTNRYKNFIDVETVALAGYLSGSNEFFNRANVRISGVEARAHKNFANGFNLHGSVAYAYGEDLDTDEVLDTVAPLKAIVGVGFEQINWGTDLSLVASAAVDSDTNASTKPAGYGVVNLTGWWEPTQLNGLRVQAGVYNLFDKTYFDALEVKDVTSASELYTEAGRYFKVSLTQRF